MEKQSQNQQIKSHLQSGKSITALEALQRFGCLRLSGRIYDLTHEHGLNIRSKMVERNGKRVAEYKLAASCEPQDKS